MIKLVLSDIDGTIVPFGHEHVSERTLQAIETLRGAGIRFGVATGRDFVELLRQFLGHTEPFETGILSNGKKLMVDGEIVRLTLIENEGLQRVAEVMRDYPHSFVTAYPFDTEENNPVYCVGVSQEEANQWGQKFGFRAVCVDEMPDIEVIGATIACPDEERVMLEIIERCSEACPQFDFVRPSSNWTDIVPRGLNKGTALPLLLDIMGLGTDEVAVFGDAGNDVAILSVVENSVAVANATPEVKAIARWHIGPCEQDAVADALEHIARTGTLEGM